MRALGRFRPYEVSPRCIAPSRYDAPEQDAGAALYAAMGTFYAAREAANVQRGVDASVARYAAMGAHYAAATE